LKHDRRRRQPAGPIVLPGPYPNLTNHIPDLFLAVTTQITPLAISGSGGPANNRTPGQRGFARFLDLRQLAFKPLSKSRIMNFIGQHDVHAQPVPASQQVEVRRPQTARVGRMVGHGHHDMIDGPRRPFAEQPLAKRMFVQRPTRADGPFVGQE
jgi:hypothetical protein